MGRTWDRAAQQIAALPVQHDRKGRLRILMVTSRDTRRWVVPKGWLGAGVAPWQAAALEALEEAGAVGRVAREDIGSYRYIKRLDDGTGVPCRVRLFPLRVDRLKRDWKERTERRRRWFAPAAAARRVHEADLADLLRRLDRQGSDEDLRLARLLDAL